MPTYLHFSLRYGTELPNKMPQRKYSRITLSLCLCFVLILSLGFAPSHIFRSTSASSPTGIIVPLYSYPGASWQSLAQIKENYPSVPVIAVVNPSDGPGSYDSNYAWGIQELQSSGITVIGYVPTDYGNIPTWQAEQQISEYKQYYGVSGIFFDQMSNVQGYEGYYSSLSSYTSSLGMWLTVGNPGASVPSSFIGTVGVIVAYENSGLPSSSFLSGLAYDRSAFSIISYGDSWLDQSYIQAA